MKRTISIYVETSPEEETLLLELQTIFFSVCNTIVPSVIEHRCWNRFALHHLVYKKIRETSPLGSQMVCKCDFCGL